MKQKSYEYTLAQILADPNLFFSYIRIKNKKGEIVPLKLNGEQRKLLESYKLAKKEGKNLVVLKPRQIGSSTFFVALQFWLWYTSTTPQQFVSMSHTHDSSKNFMRMFSTMWDNLPEFLRIRELETRNTLCFKLSDTGASFEVKTAGASGGVRSFSCNFLHLSEFAFYPDADELLATAIPALNGGTLIIESTPNHYNDALHKIVNRVGDEDSPWQLQFFAWKEHHAYQAPRAVITDLTEEELELIKNFHLSKPQISWRRRQIKEMGSVKFKREYPLTIDEAYSAGDNQWLDSDKLEKISNDFVNKDPVPGEKYAIGVDPSGGVGKDYASVWVVDARTRQPVYHWRSNETPPDELALRVQSLSRKYNGAKVLVERNSIGEVVYNEFKHSNFMNVWTDEHGEWWQTNVKTKQILLNNLRRIISSNIILSLDANTLAQLMELQVDLKGNPDFDKRDSGGGHFDDVISLALAYMCVGSIYFEEPKQAKSVFQRALELDKKMTGYQNNARW